jgi:hypothetical protein
VGTGEAEVANADGLETFTSSNQPYFSYPEMLATHGSSAPRHWQFRLPPTVEQFEFAVYVEAALPAETGVLRWVRELGSAIPEGQPIVSLWGLSAGNVFAGSTQGVILHYDGVSWLPVHTPAGGTVRGIWGADARHVYAAADADVVAFDGNRWRLLRHTTGDEYNAVWGTSASDFYVAGRRTVGSRTDGVVLHTTDGGVTWATVLAPATDVAAATSNRSLRSITGTAGGVVVAVGLQAHPGGNYSDALVMRSTDGGATWSSLLMPYYDAHTLVVGGLWTDANGRIVAASHDDVSGLMWYSYDGGATWYPQRQSVVNLASVWGASPQELYASGYVYDQHLGRVLGVLLTSTNGGNTWGEARYDWPTYGFQYRSGLTAVWAAADGTVFAGGDPYVLYRGAGGALVQQMETMQKYVLTGVAAVSQDRAVAVGSRIDNSLDEYTHTAVVRIRNGSAWTETVLPYAHNRELQDLWRTPGGQLVAVGNQDPFSSREQGLVLRSSDDGATWSAVAVPGASVSYDQKSVYLKSVWGADDTHLWAAGFQVNPVAAVKNGISVPSREGLVVRSVDGGATWTQFTFPSATVSTVGRYLYGVAGTDANHVTVVGFDQNETSGAYNPVVLRTSDGGATWSTTQTGIPSGRSLRNVAALGSELFAVGGTIVYRSANGGATWTTMITLTAAGGVADVWGSDAQNVFVVGAFGQIWRYDGTRWSLMTARTSSTLWAVSGGAGTNVFAVGDEMAILHGMR